MFWKNKISELLKNRHHKIRVGSERAIPPCTLNMPLLTENINCLKFSNNISQLIWIWGIYPLSKRCKHYWNPSNL